MNVIPPRLEELRRCVEKLNRYVSYEREAFLSDDIVADVVERNFQLAIQICLDISTHIISRMNWGRPQDYKSAIELLSKEGVISSILAAKLDKMVSFRNILVHNYLRIDRNIVYESLKEIHDFEEFARSVVQFTEKHTAIFEH
jgi:uncharacterized protein YutE (UPF0331/DUF86 family)